MMQVEGTTPLWIAARVLLYERVDDFFRRRDNVFKTFDPEDIHDLRVSSRRLREGLTLFAPCYEPRNITRLIKSVKRVTRLLGEMRNTDEALLFFKALTDDVDSICRSDLERLQLIFQKNRTKALKRLKPGLREIAPKSLRDLYLRTINAPAIFNPSSNDIDLFTPLSDFARTSFDAKIAAITNLLPLAQQEREIEAQHRLRIAVKHFRYRMEILSPLMGADYQPLHTAVKDYQDVLGRMHDLDVFAEIIREAGFTPTVAELVRKCMVEKRKTLFSDFTEMLEKMPIDLIGERVRNAL